MAGASGAGDDPHDLARFVAAQAGDYERALAEARAYLDHPVLGPRLVECAEAALGVEGRSATEVFGTPDDMKLRSSATLFARVAPPGSAFERLLDRYFGGEPDHQTLRLVGTPAGG